MKHLVIFIVGVLFMNSINNTVKAAELNGLEQLGSDSINSCVAQTQILKGKYQNSDINY